MSIFNKPPASSNPTAISQPQTGSAFTFGGGSAATSGIGIGGGMTGSSGILGGSTQPQGQQSTSFLSGAGTTSATTNPTTTGGLFQPNTAKPSGGMNFGLGGTTSTLGGMGMSSTTSGFSGLGAASTNKPGGTMFPSTSFQQPTQTQPSQPTQPITQSNKRDYQMSEILNVIQNYMFVISTNSEINKFKAMLYNRVPKGNEHQIELFQQYQEKAKCEDNQDVAIDRQLWYNALNNNPDRTLFYPSQISSPLQLFRRIKGTQFFEFSALETIFSLQSTLNKINNQYDNDIESKLSEIKKKLQIMKNKQLLVISKLERLSLILGKAEKNYSMENLFSNKLETLRTVLTENNEYSKIKELSSVISILGNEEPFRDEADYFKEFDNKRLEKNISILADMKKIFDVTFGSLKNNLETVNFIRSDLEKMKKYGKSLK